MDRIERLLKELDDEISQSVDRFHTPGEFYHHAVHDETNGGASGKPLLFSEHPPQLPALSGISHILIGSDSGRDNRRGASLQQCE